MRSAILNIRTTTTLVKPSSFCARQLASTSRVQADVPTPSNAAPVTSGPARKYPRSFQMTALDEEELRWDLDEVEDEDERHMSSYGWDIHRQQREFYNMMRTLERDEPVLQKFRRPYRPPTPSQTPILVRSTAFAGESGHPLTAKRSIVVPVSRLPLENETAIHNLKVIAGSRWVIEPPKNGGLPSHRHEPLFAEESGKPAGKPEGVEIGKEGYVQISCELFPESQMNLKWCMDTLRRLVKESNDRSSPSAEKSASFLDMPLPTRHHSTRLRSQGRGGGNLKAERRRVTIGDFPKEWLPIGGQGASDR